MKTFILLLYLWSTSDHGTSTMVSEYTSIEKCEAAGNAASRNFSGWNIKTYYVCAEK